MHPACSPKRRAVEVALALVVLLLVSNQLVHAQRGGNTAIGIELGEPSGITLLLYSPPGPSWDFLAAWDFDDFFFLNVHALFERHLGMSRNVHLFYGPGGFIGLRDRGRDDDEVVLGISGTIGLGFLFDRFEIYGRVTPRLSVVPDTDGDFGAGVGFRFFF